LSVSGHHQRLADRQQAGQVVVLNPSCEVNARPKAQNEDAR
jgi:hypothetical protein